MKTSATIAMLLFAWAGDSAEAGKTMAVCRDAEGIPVFSDRGCPPDNEREGTHFSPSAKGYRRNWSDGDVNRLTGHEIKSDSKGRPSSPKAPQ